MLRPIAVQVEATCAYPGQSIVPRQTASVADVTPAPSATVKPEGRAAGVVTGLKVTMKKK